MFLVRLIETLTFSFALIAILIIFITPIIILINDMILTWREMKDEEEFLNYAEKFGRNGE